METIDRGDTLEPGGLPILEAVPFRRQIATEPLFDTQSRHGRTIYIYFPPPAIFALLRNPRFSFSRDFRERESDELALPPLVRCFFLPHRRELFVNRRASIIRFLELRETYASSRACQPVVFQTGERAGLRETVNQISLDEGI